MQLPQNRLHYLPVKTVLLLMCTVLWKAESFQPQTETFRHLICAWKGCVCQTEWKDVYRQRKNGTEIQI